VMAAFAVFLWAVDVLFSSAIRYLIEAVVGL
jgi:preprotein translocase subunit SecE